MRLRWIVAALVAVLVSGCWWQGAPFYTGDPADAAPIKPGLYRVDMLGDHKPARTVRVAWLPDGSISWTFVKPRKDEKTTKAVMVRFAVPGRDLWIVQDAGEGKDLAAYGLAELRGDTLRSLPVIDCDSTTDIVRAAGGTVSGGQTPVAGADAEPANLSDAIPDAVATPTNQNCTFPDRAALDRALHAYLKVKPVLPLLIRIRRIGD